MKKNSWLIMIGLLLLSIVLIGCQSGDEENGKEVEKEETEETKEETNDETEASDTESTGNLPIVTMTMESGGEIQIELYPNIAENTVNNFISLVEEGFYDGVIFHRVIPGFMIQGGDPDGIGTGGPGYGIKGEFSSNGVENDLNHERGVLSMARSQHTDSAGSQFFIMVADSPHLNGEYAGFGKVIEGMDVADEIVAAERDGSDKPHEDQVIAEAVVELNGYEPADVVKE